MKIEEAAERGREGVREKESDRRRWTKHKVHMPVDAGWLGCFQGVVGNVGSGKGRRGGRWEPQEWIGSKRTLCCGLISSCVSVWVCKSIYVHSANTLISNNMHGGFFSMSAVLSCACTWICLCLSAYIHVNMYEGLCAWVCACSIMGTSAGRAPICMRRATAYVWRVTRV